MQSRASPPISRCRRRRKGSSPSRPPSGLARAISPAGNRWRLPARSKPSCPSRRGRPRSYSSDRAGRITGCGTAMLPGFCCDGRRRGEPSPMNMGGQRRRARCTFGRDGPVRNTSARGIRAAASTGFTEESGVVDALDSLASADNGRQHDHDERWRTGLRPIRDLGCGVVQFALVRAGPAAPGLCRAGNRLFQPDCDRRSNLVVAWNGDQRRLHRVQQRAARDRTRVAHRELRRSRVLSRRRGRSPWCSRRSAVARRPSASARCG